MAIFGQNSWVTLSTGYCPDQNVEAAGAGHWDEVGLSSISVALMGLWVDTKLTISVFAPDEHLCELNQIFLLYGTANLFNI